METYKLNCTGEELDAKVAGAYKLQDLEITENGEYFPPPGIFGFGKVLADIDGLPFDMGEFMLTADTEGHLNDTPALIPHALGAKPDFICVWTDDLVGVTNPDSTYSSQVGQLWLNNWMGLENWGTSASKFPGTTIGLHQSRGSTDMSIVKPNALSYVIDADMVTEAVFPLCYARNAFWRAGLTYKYFVSRAWWAVGGGANAE